jgi:hypothetical protein
MASASERISPQRLSPLACCFHGKNRVLFASENDCQEDSQLSAKCIRSVWGEMAHPFSEQKKLSGKEGSPSGQTQQRDILYGVFLVCHAPFAEYHFPGARGASPPLLVGDAHCRQKPFLRFLLPLYDPRLSVFNPIPRSSAICLCDFPLGGHQACRLLLERLVMCLSRCHGFLTSRDLSLLILLRRPNRDNYKPGLGFFSLETAWNTLQGYEVMNMVRKGQIRGVEKGDILGQVAFIASVFGVAA